MLMTVGAAAEGPRVERDEEMDERRKTSREGSWVVRGAEICKQI